MKTYRNNLINRLKVYRLRIIRHVHQLVKLWLGGKQFKHKYATNARDVMPRVKRIIDQGIKGSVRGV